MIDWPLALSTVSQAIKFANDLRSIDKDVSQAELKLKIADLTTTLADIKITLTDAKGEAAEKDDEIARLQKLQHRLAEDTVEQYGYRYRKRKDGKENPAGNRCVMSACRKRVCLLRRLMFLEKAFRRFNVLIVGPFTAVCTPTRIK
jgi:hypothetical protein